MKNRMHFLVLTVLSLLLASCNPESKGTGNEESPNIILIMADDMGYECLGAYGSRSYVTPNLDRIADESVLVTNCISNPLCTPSRVKIMTGLRNYRNYEYFGYLNPESRTFGHVMKDAGYNTCIVGKWQLNGIYHDLPGNQDLSRPHTLGFDEYCLWQVHKMKKEGERFADPLIVQNGEVLPRDPDAYGPHIFASYAIDFMERNRDNKFFLYYPMVLVHDPFVPTPDSEAWSDPGRRYENDTSYYKDMVAYTDKIVGQIDQKLGELGIRENTLLIFTGDNGTNRSIVSKMEHGSIKGAKGNTIDHGVHVPLVMQWPARMKEPQQHGGIIEFTDFFATFADIVEDTSSHDGYSFLGLFGNENYRGRKYAFVHYDPQWGKQVNRFRNRFVQDREHKLYQDGRMFNIGEDVLEQSPLDSINANKSEEKQRDMQKLLDEAPAWKVE